MVKIPTRWQHNWRIGRLQIGIRIIQHVYSPGLPDRWVIQPNFVYDRKKRSS